MFGRNLETPHSPHSILSHPPWIFNRSFPSHYCLKFTVIQSLSFEFRSTNLTSMDWNARNSPPPSAPHKEVQESVVQVLEWNQAFHHWYLSAKQDKQAMEHQLIIYKWPVSIAFHSYRLNNQKIQTWVSSDDFLLVSPVPTFCWNFLWNNDE